MPKGKNKVEKGLTNSNIEHNINDIKKDSEEILNQEPDLSSSQASLADVLIPPRQDSDKPYTRPPLSAKTPLSAFETANGAKRIPLHRQKRLAARHRPGYVPRYIDEDKIESRLLAGYSFVSKKEDINDHELRDSSCMGSAICRSSGGKKQYLMEIPKEIWEEDQADKVRIQTDLINNQLHNRDDEADGVKIKKLKSNSMETHAFE